MSGRHTPTCWIPLLLLAALATGCESIRTLSVPPGAAHVSALGDAPAPAVVVEKQHRVVVQLLTTEFSTRATELPTFLIAVTNRGDAPLAFGPGNVRAFCAGGTVDTLRPEEVQAKLDAEAKRQAEEYTGQQAEVILQSDASRVDPSSALANLEAAERANAAGKKREWRLELRDEIDRMIAPQQIAVGQAGGGLLKLDPTDLSTDEALDLRVAVDGEIYEFTFNVGRR